MPVNPSEIFNSATNYIRESDEVSWRNAVSRAYYAFFHHVCGSLQCLPTPPRGCGTHKNLTEYLVNASEHDEGIERTILRKTSYQLNQAKTLRVKADYHVMKEYSRQVSLADFQTIESFYKTAKDTLKRN